MVLPTVRDRRKSEEAPGREIRQIENLRRLPGRLLTVKITWDVRGKHVPRLQAKLDEVICRQAFPSKSCVLCIDYTVVTLQAKEVILLALQTKDILLAVTVAEGKEEGGEGDFHQAWASG